MNASSEVNSRKQQNIKSRDRSEMVCVFFFSVFVLFAVFCFISVFSDKQRLYFGGLLSQDLSVGCWVFFPCTHLFQFHLKKSFFFSGMPELFLVFHLDL